MLESSDESPDNGTPSANASEYAARQGLFTELYAELHRIARRELAHSGRALTLSPTMLLHEAYLSISQRDGLAFPDRTAFMAYAARAMRGLVIDYARSRRAQKRGGEFEFTALPTEVPELVADHAELERLGDAIDALAEVESALAQVVDLKFFCGLSFAEIAALRGVCERTVQRDWDKARIFLHRMLRDADAS